MSILDFITLVPTRRIDAIEIGVELEESHQDDLQITEHPIDGTVINDHAFKRQPELKLQCGWSNAQLAALGGSRQARFQDGSMTRADYVSGIYSQLLALQERHETFDVVTSLRTYRNMALRSLAVTRNPRTGEALFVTATLRQLHVVSTQTTRLPPRRQQARPAATGETTNAGSKAAVPATPAPGGAVPPQFWKGA